MNLVGSRVLAEVRGLRLLHLVHPNVIDYVDGDVTPIK